MSGFLKRHWRKALILPPVVLAVVVFLLAMEGRKPPVRAQEGETARPVRVIEVPRLDVVPRATGYGEVEPAREWQAVAEVSGRITWLHPDFARGAILAEGTDLIRFDPADYELALAEARAQLAEIDARETNTRDSLAIEQRSLDVLRRDLERKTELRRTGAISQTALDEARRALLQGEQQVQSLRSTLNLIPSQRQAVETRVETARLNIDRTTVRAPFDIRVRQVDVEHGQYAQRGQTLATADGIEAAEVAAQVPLARLFPLLPQAGGALGETGVVQAAARLPALLALAAEVRLQAGQRTVTWEAEVARLAETVDPKTRTVGVIVRVDDPYGQATPGERPALVRGMFVEVAFAGRAREDHLVIPRSALHEGRRVYVVGADGRLEIRPVQVAWEQDDIAVLDGGLEVGARIVVTDLIPAVEGMALDPQPDPAALDDLTEAAGGDPGSTGAVR